MPAWTPTRRKMITGSTAAMLGLAAPQARAQAKRTIRYSVLTSENNPDYPAYLRFKERVERESQGTLEMKLYPNAQLGTEREATEQVKLGAIEMTAGGGDVQGYVPQVGLFYLPFLYPSDTCFKATWDAATSPVAQRVAELIRQRTQTIRALSFLTAGTTRNVILRAKPVRTLRDFRSVKIRVDTAPTSFKTMQLLGASPTPMAFPEVYNALQTGVIDAAENDFATMMSQRWAEVCKFVSVTEHNRTMHVCMINEPFFQTLDPKQREVLTEAARALAKERHELLVSAMGGARGKMEAMGIAFNNIEDRPAWIAAAAPLQDSWAQANNFEAELAQVRKVCA